MYVLSWLSLFIQVAFITLAVGESADPGRARPGAPAANRCCSLQLGADNPELVLLDLRRTFRWGCLVPETHPCSRSPGTPYSACPLQLGQGKGPCLSHPAVC